MGKIHIGSNVARRGLDGGYIPHAFVAGIVLFMVLDLAFIALAKKTYTGVYTENYYQKGVDFSKLNRQSIYRDKTGWKAEIVYNEASHELKFYISSAGKPLVVDRVLAKIMRPVTNKFDVVFEMQAVGEGVYALKHEFVGKGQWEVRIKASKGSEEHITTKRWVFI